MFEGYTGGTIVAPLAGAWIEIRTDLNFIWTNTVAPLAGAWIEITEGGVIYVMPGGRSPRGGVD